ncbi:MAG: DUF1285 domain-containing protein [Acinetobacter populi]|jgi:hypothetical protein|uniref:DUF1285 domain-containing protein n=1 Tax=Acinetobacter populi TaxID=1582270 RepID=UPI0023560DA1|nr:DUF1285 domain-containing protein [Acinetobacter populi]MCH4247838.1 DUF1285 domain-containing protein [Acinetobacter populi]
MVSDANLQSLSGYLKQLEKDHTIPPLEKWNPEYCGEMDLVIKANGEWWHEGSPIRRQNMIDLFSRVLWKEEGSYYLKTPVEKIKIQVEDAPLLVTQVDQIEIDGQTYLQFTTQTQDVIVADQQHPVFIRRYVDETGESEERPYIKVRFGLDALIQRQVFYHLVNYGELFDELHGTCLKLHSGTTQFTLYME